MWPFRKKTPSRLVQRRLAALSIRVAQGESDLRLLKLEWLETLDKVNRLMSRVAKRAALDNPTPPDNAGELEIALSRSDRISAEIRERRAKGNHG